MKVEIGKTFLGGWGLDFLLREGRGEGPSDLNCLVARSFATLDWGYLKLSVELAWVWADWKDYWWSRGLLWGALVIGSCSADFSSLPKMPDQVFLRTPRGDSKSFVRRPFSPLWADYEAPIEDVAEYLSVFALLLGLILLVWSVEVTFWPLLCSLNWRFWGSSSLLGILIETSVSRGVLCLVFNPSWAMRFSECWMILFSLRAAFF